MRQIYMPGSIRGALPILCATATSGGSRLAATDYLPDPAEGQSNVELARSELPEYILPHSYTLSPNAGC
jgi:hypothetical protein